MTGEIRYKIHNLMSITDEQVVKLNKLFKYLVLELMKFGGRNESFQRDETVLDVFKTLLQQRISYNHAHKIKHAPRNILK